MACSNGFTARARPQRCVSELVPVRDGPALSRSTSRACTAKLTWGRWDLLTAFSCCAFRMFVMQQGRADARGLGFLQNQVGSCHPQTLAHTPLGIQRLEIWSSG